jgi:hypothetical protein
LELEVIFDGERELPRREGTTGRDQFWKIGCIIEEQVPIWTVGMPHQWNTQLALFSTHGARFDPDVVHSLTVPRLKEAVMIATNERNLGENPQEHMYASARLVNYDLIWCNLDSQTVQENDFLGKSSMISRDTLRGSFDQFEYGLFKRGKDCEVHLRLRKGAAISPRVFRDTFSALLRSIAFLHGQHAWPQWKRIELSTRVLDEFATAPRIVPKTIFTVLTPTACANHADPTSVIEKAVDTFLRADEFSRSLEDYIFVAREAGANETPLQVGTLSLCATFEGLIGLLHKQVCEGESSAQTLEFLRARGILISYIEKQRRHDASEERPVIAWNRFAGIVSSATPVGTADRYRELVNHFQLPWEDKTEKELDSWKSKPSCPRSYATRGKLRRPVPRKPDGWRYERLDRSHDWLLRLSCAVANRGSISQAAVAPRRLTWGPNLAAKLWRNLHLR